jgi:DMSO/TMAO reductase YedYZ heme-binding membrane subunit
LRSKSAFEKNLIFVLLQIIIILLLLLLFMILDHFDVLISKMNFKKWQKLF